MNDEEVKLHTEGHGGVFTQPELAALPSSLAGWMANPFAVSHPSEVEKACLEAIPVANSTSATLLRVVGSELIQKYR
nr:hypothetical protein [Tanacetum cinerariifolium]